MEEEIIVGFSTIVPAHDKITTLEPISGLPVTFEDRLKRTPQELAKYRNLMDLDVLTLLSKGTNHDGGQVITESSRRWMTDELRDSDSKMALDTITRNVFNYLVSNTSMRGRHPKPKVSLKADSVVEADFFGEVLLRHIIRSYPKLCHPEVEAGRRSLKKLVHLIKYLKTEHCRKENGYMVTEEKAKKVFAEYCRFAYPYPISGDGEYEVLLRHQFLCFNRFALEMARCQQIPDLRPAFYAINVMNIESPDGTRQLVNHESILVTSEWLVFSVPFFFEIFEKGGWNSLWLQAYYRVVGYKQVYSQLSSDPMTKGFSKRMTATIDKVRNTVNVDFLKYEKGRPKERPGRFQETLDDILKGHDKEGCRALGKEIRDLHKQAEATTTAPWEKPMLMKEIQEKLEIVCGLVPIEGASSLANALIKIQYDMRLQVLAEQAILILNAGR
ncbi:hypothetical protein F5X96DRAFT_668890 [Biscogniauxia mediterranea]|nr:hypothetical protein F5X96DRAFT_668890 [Biscogniauxia mediterranea]